jgi:hypothetical protein
MTGQAVDLTGAAWHKSTYSNNGGNCVEVAENQPGAVAVRDSRDPAGPSLIFTPSGWADLLTSVRDGGLTR